MEAITSFLASNEALRWLGLPGFVLLLSYLFYRYLIQKSIISRLSKSGSLIVVLSIIAFFAFALFISIDKFSDQRKVYGVDDTQEFLSRLSFSTSLESIEKVFGTPSAVDNLMMFDDSENQTRDTGITTITYQKGKSIYLAVYSIGTKIVGYGLWGKDTNIPIPMYSRMIPEMDEVPTLTQLRLKNFHMNHCTKPAYLEARTAWFLIGPCYLGAGGKYNEFAFAFDSPEDDFEDCYVKIAEWWIEYNSDEAIEQNPNFRCKSLRNSKAIAVAISSPDLETDEESIPDASIFLSDLAERIGFGKGFT